MKQKKREGTPEKVSTPNATVESVSDPSKSNVIFDEELEKISINEDALIKLRESWKLNETPEEVMKDVIVQKLKSEEERNKPKQKCVKVLKHAPPDSRVRPMEFIGGVRLDADNNIIPHSILGDVDDFLNEAVKRGQVEHLPLPKSRESTTSLTVKYEKTPRKPIDAWLAEDSALKNWQKKMLERKKQQGYISKMVHMPPKALVMNRGDNIREMIEEQHVIDRTIPLIDYGKGYRVGSEFWNQQLLFGDEIKGIHASLTHTEKGYPPVIEHIGIPDTIRSEKNFRPSSSASVHHPWNNPRAWNQSAYYLQRRKQLRPLITELDPHKPEFDHLEVIGRKAGRGDAINRLDLSQVTVPTIDEESVTRDQDRTTMINQSPTGGPRMIFDGTEIAWTGDSFSNAGYIEAEARVTFECYATQRVMSTLEIVNNGTTTINYEWKNLPVNNPFDLVNAKVQRFYFNTSSSVILPGDSMRVPFIFKSPNAGIFTEQWQFETKPVLAGGAALIVTLRGVSLQEDHYAADRNEIEADLRYRQAAQIVTQILDTIVDGIQTPERCRSPIDAFITEEEIFRRHNERLLYQHNVAQTLQQLYLDLYPEEERAWREWDLCVETINEIVINNNCELDEDGRQKVSDEDTETFLQRLNNAVIEASYPHFTPVQNEMYRLAYDLLANSVDSMVEASDRLRLCMGLPGKEHSEFPEELADNKKKPDPKKAVKQDPKGAKSPEKKGKDATKSIKVSKTPSLTKVASRNEAMTPSLQPQDSNVSLADSSKVSLDLNPLEDCYKQKLYSLTYTEISDCIDRILSLFDEVKVKAP